MTPGGIVVIGAGLAGAATARELARRGHQVTVLERTTPANEYGSSHGSARIFRYAYPDPFYAELVLQARAGWDELQAAAGQSLITATGALDFGDRREPARLAAVLADLRIEHELLAPEQAAERWPQIRFDSEVLWHPSAGVIDAQSAVQALIALAEQSGAQLLSSWPVREIVRDGAGFRIVGADGAEQRAAHVVIAAGGWLPELLPGIQGADAVLAGVPALQVREEQAFHFPYRDDHRPAAAGPNWPTFIHKSRGFQAYGLPGGRDAGFAGQKVAEYNAGPVISSAAAATNVVRELNRDRTVAYVERHLPGLVPEPYAETTCLFTNTPTEDFVIDGRDGLTVVSPCSGHGAKFAPLIGRLAADAVTGAAPVPHRFRLNRSPV